MHRLTIRDRVFITVAISLLGAVAAHAQHPTDIIKGRVTTDSGVAITGADVIATVAPTAISIMAKTDSAGDYLITIPDGTGQYILYASALGRKPFRQRLNRTGTDTVMVLNIKLESNAPILATVRVVARHPRPQRTLGATTGMGTDGMDKTVDGVTGALSPDLQTNIDAMASTIPGLAITPGGVSAFGLGPESNMTTLNGLAFPGGDIPRGVNTRVRFQLSPWDPTLGGFSGALASQTMGRGGNVSFQSAYATLDARPLQFAAPTATPFGQTYSRLLLDEGGSGPIVLDKYFYNYGAHFARSETSVSSLLSLDADALTHAGIAPDSAARLLQILGAQGIPSTLGGIPSQRITTSGSFISRFDRAPDPAINGRAPGQTWALTTYANLSESEANGLAPTALPASSGKTTTTAFALQGISSTYFGANGDYLSETTSGLSFNRALSSPYVNLPSGSVLVASTLPDGSDGLNTLGFGGNSALLSDSKSWSWETVNQTSFLPGGHTSLPLHIYLQSRLDGFDQTVAANRLGSFGFTSLSNFANNAPSSFARTLNAPQRSGGQWIGAGALGGNWNTTKVAFTGGARIDANAFTATPGYNPEIDRLFGLRTDHAPNGSGVSPRLGFTWYYEGSDVGGSSYATNMAQINRGGQQIHGGVGEFRNLYPSTLLANAISSTGLPGGTEQLLCLGPAAPMPDWKAYESDPATIPQSCANGATAFADTAPAVTLFDRSYSAPHSWRGQLGWTNTVKGLYLAIDGAYSLNLNQPGTVNLNFAGAPRFTLANEGNRPVFVDPSSIVPSSGSVSPVQARVSNEFGQVADRVSDLRSDSRTLTIYAIPNIPFTLGVFTLGYTYADNRSQQRGFDGSTAGDPRVVEWAPTSIPHHQFLIQGAYQPLSWLSMTTFVRAVSGFQYTPLVSGDINGDGSSNDRAFVFNPTVTSDTAVASGMRTLLSSGSSQARSCLVSQLGTVAARNSCTGPWSATMDMNLNYIPQNPGTSRTRTKIHLTNVLGGVDELLHGSNKLHGWGSPPVPNPTLLQVQGFNPTTQRFIYQVNPRFGNTSQTAATVFNPFRITLDVSVDIGRSAAAQSLEQNLRIRPGLVGTHAPADTIKKRYMARSFSDIYAAILFYGDSLALSREQVEQVQVEQQKLRARADTIMGSLAAYLVALPPNYDEAEPLQRINTAMSAVWVEIYAERPFLIQLLTPAQIRRLPESLYQMVTVPGFKMRFFFGL